MAPRYQIIMLTFGLFLLILWNAKPTSGKAVSQDDYDTVEVGLSGEVDDDNDELNPRVICVLPMKRGHCRALLLRWRYDPESKDCTEFKYGGCSGNENNFLTKKSCMSTCQGV